MIVLSDYFVINDLICCYCDVSCVDDVINVGVNGDNG
jgi:hypothetical protein